MSVPKSFLLAAVCAFCLLPARAQQLYKSGPVSVAHKDFGFVWPRIVLVGNNVPFVVWGHGSQIAYGSKWGEGGFAAPVRLGHDSLKPYTAGWTGTQVASLGNLVYVVFKVNPYETGAIYIAKSDDGGATFSDAVRVDNVGSDWATLPSVAIDADGNPVVMYMRSGMGWADPQYMVAPSNDGGATFAPDVNASEAAPGEVCDCCPGTIVADGNRMAVLYRNNENHIRNIWASITHDGGKTFEDVFETDQTNWLVHGCPSTGPDGFFAGDKLVSTWMSKGDLYIGEATLDGNVLLNQKITETKGNFPRIAGSGDTMAVVWQQYHNGKWAIMVAWSTTGASGIGLEFDTVASSVKMVENADIAYADGVFHVVWQNPEKSEAYYRRLGFSEFSGLAHQKSRGTISLFPNPATTTLNIALPEGFAAGRAIVQITDMTGRTVKTQATTVSGQMAVDTEGLPPGSYFVRIVSEGRLYVAPFVKQAP